MNSKLVALIIALGVTSSAHGQDGTTIWTQWALPSNICVANTPADETLLRRSIEGLRNISPTRTVWVTCSLPMTNYRTPPNDDNIVMSMTMWATTDLPRVTVPCRGAVNVGTGPGEFAYFWDQESTGTDGVAIVGIEPQTEPGIPHRTFGMMCKIPQLSALTEFQVDIAQTQLTAP
jgi:hypothetical protein